jgi:hypothetical protein
LAALVIAFSLLMQAQSRYRGSIGSFWTSRRKLMTLRFSNWGEADSLCSLRVLSSLTHSRRCESRPLGIAVRDHVIVGKDGHASLKGLKLI